ncbi:MAG: DUF58 domain-containing protein [Chloroflexi bacterium]|nr:DUF58 domain-containing protein [Chloroflexota bacterium]MQC26822.1 DUF58 domain-containing protein [Chloroflexota bacterium]
MLADNWIIPLSILFLLGLALEIPVLTILALAMGLLLGAAAFWRDRVLNGVSYSRRLHFRRGFPGEDINVRIEVKNEKLLPIPWLIASDLWPRAAAPVGDDSLENSHLPGFGRLVNVLRMPPLGQVRREYRLRLEKRGVYPLGPVRLETGDPFGLYAAHKEAGEADTITIYPELADIRRFELPSASPFGERRVRRHLFEDPSRPMGVRDYQLTDEFRRVHWPATARTGKMQSKVYEPTAERVMVLCLNTATSKRHWEGVYPEILEHLVRTAAAVAYQVTQDGYQVGLVSNATMSNSDQPYRILPGRSNQQLALLLTALAGVTPLVGLPFHRYLLRELPKLPYGTVMLVITAVVDELLLETLFEACQHGRKVVLLSVAEEPPPTIKGIQTIHMPYQEVESQAVAK